MKMFNKIWQSAVIASMVVAPLTWSAVAIYMCGDSTMQDWAEGYYPKQGQGQDFHFWFDPTKATVVNRGQGGMSLGGGGLDKKGNTAVGYYDMFFKKGCSNGNCIAEKLKAGDYVVIQFGINDVNYSTEDFFASNMKKMVSDVRAKGAYPIIMSPIRRKYYDSPTQIHNSYRGYPALNKSLAEELNVPFIDMSEMVANYMISVGERYAEQYVFNYATKSEYSNLGSDQTDAVHLQMNGANAFGRIITEQMRAHSDPIVKKLGDYMAPMYQVEVKVSPEGAAEATSINAYYPKGMTVMLKTIPKSGKKFLGWYDGNGNKVGAPSRSNVKSPYIHTFVMGSASTQFTAVYEGGTAQKYTGDGAALTAFPTTTPKSLDDVTFVPFTPIEGSTQDTVKIDKDIKKFFDASTPDTAGIGWTQNEWTGFTGEGYYNLDNTNASFAAYKVKFPGAGYVTLAVRYANGGSSDRMFNAYLDHDYLVSAPPTGGWDKWDTAYVVMDAPQGEAELKIMSLTSDGAPNLDAFGFSIDGVCRVSEGCEEQDTSKTAIAMASTQVAFAQLNGNVLKINGSNARIDVFDMRGRLMARKIAGGEVDLSNLVKANGLYRVMVRQGSAKYATTWAKVR
ncbi:GDSL-type esterase/lipase family protein [Fibrobacter sp. UWB10]|uniref:GDSL-type esterase/lipase family protein n=1 Tax=Fibrobacter sp. UWB10 TaxID=1896201 RepID=UPI00240328B7|nr:GDSL-type esterase/lipase family protein [Fibrobacter sp. UWB10]SMP46269.1 Lysophospholipase L1 [Fibrobacter sp. UWB10]